MFHFQGELKAALKHLQHEVYRDLKVTVGKAGIVLYAGPLAVPERKLWAGFTEPKQASLFHDHTRFDEISVNPFTQEKEQRITVGTLSIKKK